MTHTKQKKYLDKVAQWLCDDTQYCVNPMIIGNMETCMVLYFPFINDEKHFDGYYMSILDEGLNWDVKQLQDLGYFANLFSIYVKETYGVHKKECNQLWDVYRNKLKRQWGLY